MRPRRRQQRLVRAVVYVLVLLVVIGMILAMVGSTLAAAAPTGPAPEAASSSRPAPVVVLGTSNLTWADLQKASHTTAGEDLGSRDVGSAATHLLSFTSGGEPMSLSVRTPADRTCPADGWLTLGRGARASAVEPTDSCTGTTAAIPGDTPLIRALGGDISVQAVGPRAQLATGAPGSSPSTSVSLAPSLPEALADGADLTVVDTARDVSTDAERINALDDALRTAQEQAPPGTRIIVASLADDEDPGPQMAVLPAGTTSTRGTSDGLVIGTSTHRPGLAQLTDLTPTLTTALTGRSDPAFDGQSLGLPTGGGTSVPPNTAAPDDSRIARLADDALHARASQRTVIPAGALLMGSAVALLVWAAVALRDPRADRRPARRRRAAGAATFLSALPTALLLVNAVPWWRAGAREGAPSAWSQAAALTGATVIAACVTGLAAGTTTLVRRRRHLRPVISSSASEASAPPLPLRPSPSPVGLTSLLVTATIPLAWLVDAATGAHLAFNNPLGMNAVVAGRFYGVSNTAFALVAGALVVVIAGTWEHLGRGRRTALVATCLLGGAALVVDGAPQLGADVGGALTLVPTLAFLGAGLAGMRLSWRRWLAIGGATLLVVGGFAVVDLLRPGGPTHLGRFARQVADGSALGVLGRKAYALVGPFIAKPMATAGLACALALLAAALWWLRRQVRDWHAGTSPYAWVAPSVRWVTVALRSLGVLTLMSVLVNDSGVTMAGFILAAAAPALMALLLAPAQIETDTALRPTDASHDAGV
ncbi:hypothetical protein [Actinomyces sp. oral taxon 170]|uniref:hypothetical protein n=1 Tax=Actinomyces sp. oral taxon 170 TaxID=712117 RepID=UPI0020A05EB6|nr:hypothetical protein [Actinomyces sp. oral taxon 170]